MKILHTADLQLGLKLRFLAPETAARLRAARFDTLRAIADLARTRSVDAVVVAGDVLEDNALTRDTLQQASDALERFGGLPVLLLPGNHDAATPDSALARMDLPKGVILANKREVIPVGEALFYPCPLMRRHETDDPTAWLPERQPGEGVRVAIAHGGVLEFSESTESPNRIDAGRVEAKGFDYLALGDWHGTLRFTDRAWYSGAPEATRFKERDPGNVLIVDIPAPGATPEVEVVPVARTRWIGREITFTDDAQVAELAAWLASLPERSSTLVELVLDGALTLGGRDALDALLDEYAQRLAHLRCDPSTVLAQPTEADLAAMKGEGFVNTALERLRSSDDPLAQDAVRLLYRMQQEAARASA